jgi:hypothetical protein
MYTLQGKTQPTHHTLSTLSPRMVHDHTYLTWSIYSNLSYSRQQIWTDPLHPRKRLTGPYHRHAIGTFNTCSRGPTERSLIDTGGGYKLRGAGLPHTHSPTFPTSYPHFPLMAPPGLHFNQILAKHQSVEFLKNLWPPCGLSTTWTPTVAYI